MNEYTDVTREVLVKIYKDKGLEEFLKIAYSTIKTSHKKDDQALLSGVHGEVCETVLEVMLHNYVKNYRPLKRCKVSKSLVLPIGPEYTTELDLTLFTESRIIVFECKCYKGDKIMRDKGTIVRKNIKPTDVWDQNLKHIKHLHSHVSPFIRPTATKFYLSAFFRFDTGTMVDEREDEDKFKFPILTVSNLYPFLDKVIDDKKRIMLGDLTRYITDLERHNKELQERHLKNVTNK